MAKKEDRLRVLYLDPLGNTLGPYTYSLTTALSKRGVDITLATSEVYSCAHLHQPFPVLYPFKSTGSNKGVVRKGLEYLDALSYLLRLNKGNRHSIIHAHFLQLPPADILFLRAMKSLGSRVVITVHDVLPYNPWPGQRLFYHLLYHLADRLIAHTNSIKMELMRTFHLQESIIAVTPIGSYVRFADDSITRQKAREALGLDNNRPTILFFGQIKKNKGLEYLIRAHALVLKAFPQALLIVAGKLWKESFVRYDSLIRELDIEHAVQCRIEYIPDEEIPFYFQGADIVALPYTKVYSSAVLQLAMSYGRPIVASSLESLAEIVDEGKSALLVPPENEEELAKAIIYLLSNPEAAAEMGRCARKMSEERFGWEGIAEATERIYIEGLKGTPSYLPR